MATNGSRIPKVRKDANAGAWKVASTLNKVSKVLQIADLYTAHTLSPLNAMVQYNVKDVLL